MSSATVTVVLAPAGPSRTISSTRAAIVHQKPKTIAAIQPVKNDLETERTRRKEELAAALRVVAKQNIDHFTSGHVSCRDPIDTNTFWVNPVGVACGLITVSHLVQVTFDCKVVSGGQAPYKLPSESGAIIDATIYKARPEVNAICHAHTPYGTAFSALGTPFEFLTHDSCAFYNDIGTYGSFNGIVLDDEEGENIKLALGSKKAVVLQNHGLLTVGSSIRSAIAWFIMLDRECQIQLLVNTAASNRGINPIVVSPEEAQFTYHRLGGEDAGYVFAGPYFQMIEAEYGEQYKK